MSCQILSYIRRHNRNTSLFSFVVITASAMANQRSSLSGRNFDTGGGSSTKVPYSARGSFDQQGSSPFDMTRSRQPSARAMMSGNFVMTAADVDRITRDGQRSARRSLDRLDRSQRNSLDKSARLSGRQSERNSERKKSRRMSYEK